MSKVVAETEGPRRLSQREWLEAKALWELGNSTLDELSARYGISRDAISRRFRRDGVIKGSRASEQAREVAKQVAEQDKADSVMLLARIKETRENHYEWSTTLAKMAVREIAEAIKNKREIAACIPNLKAIQLAAQVVKTSREERYALLGLDKGMDPSDEIPELIISEMTAEEIHAAQRAVAMGDDGMEMLSESADEDQDFESDGENEVIDEGEST
jgi:predicted DNA-binding ribbon-helix-helix protein